MDKELIDDYYIIESLGENDVKDGDIFFQSLRTIEGFEPKYFSVNDFAELESALCDFSSSSYKHLFISAHGDQENLFLTNEVVNTYDLFDIQLNKRRIFMSSFRGGSFLFAKYFISKGAYSVIGTPEGLDQIVADGMWPTMAVIFERLSNSSIKFRELDKFLKLVVKLYQIPMHYYSFVRGKSDMKEYVYEFNKRRERIDYKIK